MAQFNLNDYETVEERLKRFWANEAHRDARIITINHTTPQDRQTSMWVVEARIYLSAGDQSLDLPKTTGWAFEVDGQNGMANKTSALENCETSSIGRALANMNYSGNKRASREEMSKVQSGVTPSRVESRDWTAEVEALASKDAARKLYTTAQKTRAPKSVLELIEAKAAKFAE
jgi:hypothetical protein